MNPPATCYRRPHSQRHKRPVHITLPVNPQLPLYFTSAHPPRPLAAMERFVDKLKAQQASLRRNKASQQRLGYQTYSREVFQYGATKGFFRSAGECTAHVKTAGATCARCRAAERGLDAIRESRAPQPGASTG